MEKLGARIERNGKFVLLDHTVTKKKEIFELLRDSKIEWLFVNACGLTLEDIAVLVDVLPFTKIDHLTVGWAWMTDECIAALLDTVALSNITELLMPGTINTNGGALILAEALPRLVNLKDLGVHRNVFTLEGVRAIAAALAKTRIEYLYMAGSRVCIEGAKAIAAVLPFCALVTMNINENDIGDEGLNALIETIPRSRLKNLLTGYDSGIVWDEEKTRRLAGALIRGENNRRLLAFCSWKTKTPVTASENFWRADGDTAAGHRIARFLI